MKEISNQISILKPKFLITLQFRRSHREVFCKKDVLRNFTKFTGKHMCQSLFFNKVAGLRPAILLKRRLWHRSFPVNFAKFLRIIFLTEHFRWLLLSIVIRSSSKLRLEIAFAKINSAKLEFLCPSIRKKFSSVPFCLHA